jgi:hypothetical protein
VSNTLREEHNGEGDHHTVEYSSNLGDQELPMQVVPPPMGERAGNLQHHTTLQLDRQYFAGVAVCPLYLGLCR